VPTALLTYVEALALALDDLGRYTVTSATNNSITAGGLIASTGTSANRYDRAWLYVQGAGGAADVGRVVRPESYVPTTGTISYDPGFTAPVATTPFLLTGLFPVFAEVTAEDTSYRTLVVRGLSRMIFRDRITTPITTADSYALTTWRAWLDRPERLVGVFEPAVISGRQPTDAGWRAVRLVLDAELPTLELGAPFSTASGNLTLEVLRPAHTWVEAGSGWVESTTGPTADTHQAVPSVEDFLPFGLMAAYQVLMSRSPGRPNGNWTDKLVDAREQAMKSRYWDHTSERETAPAIQPGAAA
jgi:hypothetical protein